MKVDMGTKTAPLNSIAQITAKTQISFLITPFDPIVCLILLDELVECTLPSESPQVK